MAIVRESQDVEWYVDQVEREPVAKNPKKTLAVKRTNPVLIKAHLQDIAHTKPRKRQSWTPRHSCIMLPLLDKRRSLTNTAVTRVTPGVEVG